MVRLTMAASALACAAAVWLTALAPALADSSKADWSACVKADPSSAAVDANQRIGACNRLLQSGDTSPEDAGAILAARAAAHNALRQYDEALRDIESALAQNTRVDAWEFIYRVMGRAQYGLKNYPAAEVAYRQAATYPEADAWSWARLGDVEMNQGKYRDAEGHFRKAAEMTPREAEFSSDIADALFAQGRFAEAAPLYAEALAIDAEPSAWDSVLHYLATAHAGAGDIDRLRADAAEWAEDDGYIAHVGRLLLGASDDAAFRDALAARATGSTQPEEAAFWLDFALGQRDLIAGASDTARAHLEKAAATASVYAIYINAAQFAP